MGANPPPPNKNRLKSGGLTGVQPPPPSKIQGGLRPPNPPPPLFSAPDCFSI